MKYKHSKEKQKEVLKKYSGGGGIKKEIQSKNFADLRRGDVIRKKDKVGETAIFVVNNSVKQSRLYKNEYDLLATCIVSNGSFYKPHEEYYITTIIKYGKLPNVDYLGTWKYEDKIDYSVYLPKTRKKYELGGSTGLPAGAEQHYVNHYLNEGASAGVFEQGGSLVDGYLTDPNFGDFQAGIYAEGGSLGNHGLKQGDQIIKTMSGGVQKVKTKSGDIVYVNLANGYRGSEPPMPFKNGGRLKSALVRDRKNVNYNEDYEVRYSKDKPSRSGYTKPKMSRTQFEDESFEFFANGGLIGREVTFMSNGEKDKGIIGEVNEDGSLAVDTGRSLRLVEKDEIVEIHDKPKKRGFFFADGGITKNYIDRNQLNTITIKKGDQKLTYKVSDVYNGAYKLEDGGNLEKTAFYVSKRNVVKVQLKNGKDVKVANGYWIKKGAKPIHASKYDDGGMTQDEFIKKEIQSQKEKEKGKTFKDFKVNVYEQSENKGAFPFVEPYFTNNFVEALNFAKETIKKQRNYRSTSGVLWATIDSFTPIEKRQNVRYPYSELVRVDEEHINSSKYDDGGQLKIKYAGGGDTKMVDGVMYEKVKFTNGIEDWYLSSDLHRVNFYCQENGLNPKNQKDFEKAYSVVKKYEGGGKTTFKEKATAIAKNFEGKKVKPKYQKEYGKTYDKAEAKEVGNKIAGSQKAKYDSKMSGGGKTKRGGAMVLAKQIRKEGESWASALKRANEQMKKK